MFYFLLDCADNITFQPRQFKLLYKKQVYNQQIVFGALILRRPSRVPTTRRSLLTDTQLSCTQFLNRDKFLQHFSYTVYHIHNWFWQSEVLKDIHLYLAETKAPVASTEKEQLFKKVQERVLERDKRKRKILFL